MRTTVELQADLKNQHLVERKATSLGRMIALHSQGVRPLTELDLSSLEGSLGELVTDRTDHAAGLSHAVLEIASAASDHTNQSALPPCGACLPEERMCRRVGEALSSGGIAEARKAIIEFDSAASEMSNLDFLSGISRAAAKILVTCSNECSVGTLSGAAGL